MHLFTELVKHYSIIDKTYFNFGISLIDSPTRGIYNYLV